MKVKLTKRGRRVLAALVIALTLALSWAGRDICWTGAGYGSCMELVERNR